jgi:hypothetical protein
MSGTNVPRDLREEATQKTIREIFLNLKDEELVFNLGDNKVVYHVAHTHFPGSSTKITVSFIVPETDDPLVVCTFQVGWLGEHEVAAAIKKTL